MCKLPTLEPVTFSGEAEFLKTCCCTARRGSCAPPRPCRRDDAEAVRVALGNPALADAEEEDVFSLWAGLGYYSRARNLHRAAQQVAREHDGILPRTADALRKLPGIGRYTAGALASIAYDAPEPIVDGNVIRVLTRLYGIRDDVASKPTVERLWQEAGQLAEGERPRSKKPQP